MRPRIPLGVRAAEGRPRLRRPRRLRSLGVGPGPPKQDDPRNAGAAPKQTAHERKRAAPSTGAAIEGSPTDAEQATRSNGPRFAAWLDRGPAECKKCGGECQRAVCADKSANPSPATQESTCRPCCRQSLRPESEAGSSETREKTDYIKKRL